MRYFFVFQNKTYMKEKAGSYLWSPKRNRSGGRVSHYELMKEVKKGDIILHSYNKKIASFSIARSDAYSEAIPKELIEEDRWDNDGWKIDTEYFEIPNPIVTSDHMEKILELQPILNAPFHRGGRGNTGYLYALTKELTVYLMQMSEKAQSVDAARDLIRKTREELNILGYEEIEAFSDEEINKEIAEANFENFKGSQYSGRPKEKKKTKALKSGAVNYPRDLSIAMNAVNGKIN